MNSLELQVFTVNEQTILQYKDQQTLKNDIFILLLSTDCVGVWVTKHPSYIGSYGQTLNSAKMTQGQNSQVGLKMAGLKALFCLTQVSGWLSWPGSQFSLAAQSEML